MASETVYEAKGPAIFCDNRCVAIFDTDVDTNANNEGRAHRFAVAANLHADLLNALKGMLRVCPSEKNGMKLAEYEAAREAIRQAEAN